MQFDKGYISPYFVINNAGPEVRARGRRCILIYEKKLSNVRDMLPLLEKVAQAGKPLLIIAEDVESEALAVLVVNRLRAACSKSARSRPPASATAARPCWATSPSLTGGTVHQRGPRPQAGERRRSSSSARPRQVRVEKETRTIIDGRRQARTTSRRASTRSARRWTRPRASTTRRSSPSGWRS